MIFLVATLAFFVGVLVGIVIDDALDLLRSRKDRQ